MKKRKMKLLKVLICVATIMLLSCSCYINEERTLESKLKRGTPEQKEEVLNYFIQNHPRDLIPSVIVAILDNTRLPMHDDTGWGNVYHQAASSMCDYARLIDGKYRGRDDEYSFHKDVGRASKKRQKEVYNNWKKWWKENKDTNRIYSQ